MNRAIVVGDGRIERPRTSCDAWGTSHYGFSLTHDPEIPWNTDVVKRLVILLLLFWLPLQASLAAFEEVHAHHNHASTSAIHAHDVSTGHEHALDPQAASDRIDCGADCSTSHLCTAQLMLLHAEFTTRRIDLGNATFAHSRSIARDCDSERPERPQWLASSL